MTHIKRIVMKGFKSFPNKTEVDFDKGINVIVGPNGSGKSNISDALCFALGRLSIKSMRAAKARNLLFMGSKIMRPSREASVELVFDNSNKTFNLSKNEISIHRIVRHNGQGIYKLNGETKTRAEIIEALAHAGIDPYGFNIILQGQIQSIIKMHSEDRRKIVEEVAGISIYESRKERSLKELEKTEVRLKEISTILRERTAFLRNLENERAQALRYKEFEKMIKRYKASIINKKIEEKTKELTSVRKSIDEKLSQKDNFKSQSDNLQQTIQSINNKINEINKNIQQASGIEQDVLHESISNLKAELEGSRVRKENYENRKAEILTRIDQMQASIPEHVSEIEQLRKKSPLIANLQDDIKKKKEELANIEEQRKNAYKFKTELNVFKDTLKDKESDLARVEAESNSLVKQIEELTVSVKHDNINSCKKEIAKLKAELQEDKNNLNSLIDTELNNTKLISSAETQINSAEEIKQQIQNLDLCPLCQSKMTDKHISHVNEDSDKKIEEAQKIMSESEKKLKNLANDRKITNSNIEKNEKNLLEVEKELTTHILINDKQEYLKKPIEQEKILKEEVQSLQSKRANLEKKTFDLSTLEEQYSSKILEIEEISSRTEKDVDTTLLYKEREIEKIRDVIKHSNKALEEIGSEIEEISSSIENKSDALDQKEDEEKQINEKFKKLLVQRDKLQEDIQQKNYNLSTLQNEIRQIEEQINYLKVGNARLDAEKESLDIELKDYPGIEIVKASTNVLQEKLEKAQQTIQTIGSINMRALEIYDDIKKEYDKVKGKADILEKEKEEVLKIISEIDTKKKRTFMKTFNGINELFSRNFSQLSAKGQAFLEIANKEDIFSGGVNIVIKMRKGKFFDVTSLSGGEQTLIALALLFAIQEHKPHHFYVFDEIDASLDKRNSERLSGLLKKYIKSGQYIIVTHNDAIITDSNFLYGVSMHDGVSKILSLKLD